MNKLMKMPFIVNACIVLRYSSLEIEFEHLVSSKIPMRAIASYMARGIITDGRTSNYIKTTSDPCNSNYKGAALFTR